MEQKRIKDGGAIPVPRPSQLLLTTAATVLFHCIFLYTASIYIHKIVYILHNLRFNG